ncbi:MAG: N-acetylmuramoyl-L-alanine amidase [Thermoanaerobaculia bacterium]
MSELAQIKQRLIRGAVRENVDVIRGRYRFRKPSKGKRFQALARILFFLTLPVALFFGAYLATHLVESWIGLRSAELTERVVANAREGGDPRFALLDPESTSGSVAGSEESAELSVAGAVALPNAIDRSIFPLGVRKIVVDPGHGGENTGTVSPSGLAEKEIALDISKRVEEILKQADFEVALTRTEDEFVSLEERAEIANQAEGDLFVSIHLNWIETRQVRGIETYFLGPTDDPYLAQLAAAENQDSGYSLADFRKMLDRVFADVRQDESEKLARSVQRSLYNSLRRVNPTLQDRGVKKAPFIVLTGTEMPAILAEVSCLSNAREARLLMIPEYRQFIAEALSTGIESYARELNRTSLRGS